jgi:hypothetical protein
MEKVIQEFRIIETDDGFRIEIKGDKDRLREFVMGLDPRYWMSHGPEGGPPFGPRMWGRRGRRGGWGPFRWGWGGWDDDDEEEEDRPRRKRAPREQDDEETGSV